MGTMGRTSAPDKGGARGSPMTQNRAGEWRGWKSIQDHRTRVLSSA